MSDEKLYLEATNEASTTERDEALWAKAMALAEGDKEKAKYSYIKMRVKQLAESRQKEQPITQVRSTKKDTRGSLLLEVTDNFSLYENAFVYDGAEYTYEGVSSVYYMGSVNQINLVNVGSSASLSISHDDCNDDESISVDSETWVFQTRTFKNIGKAANIISEKTYRGRLARYLHKLKTDGYLAITKVDFKGFTGDMDTLNKWEVRIYENGDITEKDLRFNLRTALKNKGFYIGCDAMFGMQGKIDPYEVWVSETGTAMWNKRIKFDITTDFDVMSVIIKSLAGIETNKM